MMLSTVDLCCGNHSREVRLSNGTNDLDWPLTQSSLFNGVISTDDE